MAISPCASLYFPNSEFMHNDPRLPIIAALKEFFIQNHDEYLGDYDMIAATGRVNIDFATLVKNIPVGDFGIPTFSCGCRRVGLLSLLSSLLLCLFRFRELCLILVVFLPTTLS